MNSNAICMTASPANCAEPDGTTLPLGSRSRLKTIKRLFELISASPDPAEVRKVAGEGVEHANTLLSWYEQQISKGAN